MDRVKEIERFLEVVSTLRRECPWDRKQTMESLRDNTIEECYELVDAINNQDYNNVKEELGDLLLHVAFYAKIASEEGRFDIADVAHSVTEKLIYRHPHVYGNTAVKDSGEVVEAWERLKQKEKQREDILSGVPTQLPAVMRAYKIQKKAASVGFDWPDRESVWDKVKEELLELEVEIERDDHDKIEEELGDLLFAIVNLARRYNIKPEDALQRCNQKFIDRFGYVQRGARNMGVALESLTWEEMDSFWNEAKVLEKR